ncbi:GMC family oxidoreductase N-terminal domain-containing protein, partial [Streptomonospora sp. DSM 45055]
DTPRLLLLSGVGPPEDLRAVGIEAAHALPGVGENLLDHPESVIMWETAREVPETTVMHSDGGLFVRRDAADERPDLMFHIYQVPFDDNTARLGYDSPGPRNAICMTPNVPRARSRGKLWLVDADPAVKPALDFRYFTDPGDYDARTIVDGLRI